MIRSLSLRLLLFLLTATVLAAQTNEGTEFYLSFPANLEEGSPDQSYIRLYFTASVATRVDIFTLGEFKGSVTTVPNEIVTFDLSRIEAQLFVREGSTPVPDDQLYPNSAVRIVAGDPIVVYGMNRRTYTSDGLLALPVSALGTEYIVASAANNIPFGGDLDFPSQFMVVAPYDNTNVTITFPMDTQGHSGGETITVPMMKGDVYSAMSVGFKGDLTGAVIRADKPVAVTAGQNCAFLPDENYFACDHLVEMLTPTETWEKSYFALPIAERTKGDTYRVIAAEAGTDIFVNGLKLTTINQVGGENGFGWIEFREEIRRPLLFTANKPIMVAQYNNGQQYDNSTSTDPFYMLLSPVEQSVSTATITTPSNDFTKNYINMIADSAGMASAEITKAGEENWQKVTMLPGVAIATMPPSPDGVKHVGATFPIQPGAYQLRSTAGSFAAYIYGGGNFDSYGYPAALGLKSGKEIIDTAPPIITSHMLCDSTVVGEIVDSLSFEERGNGIVAVILDPVESRNATLTLDGSLESRPRRIGFRVRATDAGMPADAVIVVRDSAGNERREAIDLTPVDLSYGVDPLDFGVIGVGAVTRRTALLVNGGTRSVVINDARLDDGDAGFRLTAPFTPTTIDAGDTLRIEIELTGDQAGIYHDTLILTDSCGRPWSLAITTLIDPETGDVTTGGAALAGMRLAIAPNVIDGGTIDVLYAVPSGRTGSLSIVDADARVVSVAPLTSTGGIDLRTTVDVSSLPTGRYWCALRVDGGEIVAEITIVR